jgi:hypothetical protein
MHSNDDFTKVKSLRKLLVNKEKITGLAVMEKLTIRWLTLVHTICPTARPGNILLIQ